MSAQPPLLSVIVVSRNPGPLLAATLASVWEQRWTEPELIVVDGGSTDGTREWLAARRDQLAALIASPAAGIGDALNQGVAAAHGEWLLFLGAGDRLVGDVILGELGPWLRRTEAGAVVGETAGDDGRIHKLPSRVRPLVRDFIPLSSALYRRALFADFGAFDPAFAVMAAYEFHVRLWKSHVRFKPIPLRITAGGAPGPGGAGRWRGCAEEIRIRHRYAPAWRCWGWDALSLLRFVRGNVRGLLSPPAAR